MSELVRNSTVAVPSAARPNFILVRAFCAVVMVLRVRVGVRVAQASWNSGKCSEGGSSRPVEGAYQAFKDAMSKVFADGKYSELIGFHLATLHRMHGRRRGIPYWRWQESFPAWLDGSLPANDPESGALGIRVRCAEALSATDSPGTVRPYPNYLL
jgi:hypothetical protein